ncbi:MAG: L-threonylcarbamoyladenylate synthase [Luteibaculum sp.]
MRTEIKEAARVIRQGGVILCPTETICGFSCDARNEEAIKRIFEIKKRPESKSLLCLFSSDAMINRHFQDVPEAAWELMELATTPTTVILNNPIGLAPNIAAPDNSLAIRWVKSGSAYELIKQVNVPLVSTSVNLSGESPFLTTKGVPGYIKDQVDFVLTEEEGEFGTGIPSSIIRILPGGEFKIIRK